MFLRRPASGAPSTLARIVLGFIASGCGGAGSGPQPPPSASNQCVPSAVPEDTSPADHPECFSPAEGAHAIIAVEAQRFVLNKYFLAYDDGTVYFVRGGAWWVARLSPEELSTLRAALDPKTVRHAGQVECDHVFDDGDPIVLIRTGRGRRWRGVTLPSSICRVIGDATPFETMKAQVFEFDHPTARRWGGEPAPVRRWQVRGR